MRRRTRSQSLAGATSLALLMVVGALTVAACGSGSGSAAPTNRIDPDKVEQLALQEAIRSGGSKFSPAVNCPSKISAKKDAVSYCRATFQIGGKPLVERVKVTATGAGGKVYVQLIPLAKGAFFEDEVKQIARKKKIALQQVTCPAEVERVQGQTFTCQAIVAGKPFTLTLRHIDDKGGITIVSSVAGSTKG